MRFTAATNAANPARTVDKEFIEQAMADMNTIVDFTTEDLQRLITLALQHAESVKMTPQQIVLGHYYTNGKLGSEWSVRQIIDESTSTNPRHDMVIYRVVEGTSRNSADSCTRYEFAQWAAREVVVNRA